MKKTYFLFIALVLLVLQACQKEAKISIQNNISNVRITNISWVDYGFGSLLPGQNSGEQRVIGQERDFPKTGNIRFVMTANNKSIYLETVEQYTLNVDDNLIITLTDSTEVTNPNQ